LVEVAFGGIECVDERKHFTGPDVFGRCGKAGVDNAVERQTRLADRGITDLKVGGGYGLIALVGFDLKLRNSDVEPFGGACAERVGNGARTGGFAVDDREGVAFGAVGLRADGESGDFRQSE
jgi:hypothetical protein